MKVLFFTGTGNSLYVAKRIGGELLFIPHLVKNGVYTVKDDAIGIICSTRPCLKNKSCTNGYDLVNY